MAHKHLYVRLLLLIGCMLTVESTNPGALAASKEKCQLQGYELKIERDGCKRVKLQLATCLGACVSLHVPNMIHQNKKMEFKKRHNFL